MWISKLKNCNIYRCNDVEIVCVVIDGEASKIRIHGIRDFQTVNDLNSTL